jgi:hypothetical protein
MIALLIVLAQSVPSGEIGFLEEESFRTHLSIEEGLESAPQKDPGTWNLLYLEVALRFTIPGGDVVSGGPKYSDIFNVGVGVGAQFDYLWRLSRTVDLGIYAEVDFDSFGGSTSTDGLGNTIKPETMNTIRILAGGKIRENFGVANRFFAEQFLGLGANVYPSVKGTLTSGGVETTGELFASKTAVAFDLGINIGWEASSQVGFFLGVTLEINGGPGEGKDLIFVSSSGSSTPGVMINTGINLGVNIRF